VCCTKRIELDGQLAITEIRGELTEVDRESDERLIDPRIATRVETRET
jgi:hypothetical protein